MRIRVVTSALVFEVEVQSENSGGSKSGFCRTLINGRDVGLARWEADDDEFSLEMPASFQIVVDEKAVPRDSR